MMEEGSWAVQTKASAKHKMTWVFRISK
jgi:hypothetical protein